MRTRSRAPALSGPGAIPDGVRHPSPETVHQPGARERPHLRGWQSQSPGRFLREVCHGHRVAEREG